jgi:hypothetical protein
MKRKMSDFLKNPELAFFQGPAAFQLAKQFSHPDLAVALASPVQRGTGQAAMSSAIDDATRRNPNIAQAVEIGFMAGAAWGAGRAKDDLLPFVLYGEEQMDANQKKTTNATKASVDKSNESKRKLLSLAQGNSKLWRMLMTGPVTATKIAHLKKIADEHDKAEAVQLFHRKDELFASKWFRERLEDWQARASEQCVFDLNS